VPEPSTAPETTPNSYTTYLNTHGAALSPQQQDALARQLDNLNLGGASDLSFYPLPDGSTLIANADGDLVGELGIPRDGEISLRAAGIGEDGQASTHQSYISADGKTTSYSPQTLAEVNAGLSLVKGLEGLQHWDQLGDIGRVTSLINLATNLNTLSNGALGDLGSLGSAASVLNLFQSLEHGDAAGIVSGINTLSGGVVDNAINSALGSSGIPFVSIALALNDFDKHPGQRIGEAANDDYMRKVA
jgi:hypothetical protein